MKNEETLVASVPPTKNQITEFARALGVSFEDWGWLLSFEEFSLYLDGGEFGCASVFAVRKLAERDNPPLAAEARRAVSVSILSREERHELVRRFVQIWAAKTGRTGKSGKQSRQCRIRRLMHHGLNSAYAMKLRKEAGI